MRYYGVVKDEIRDGYLCSGKKTLLLFSDKMREYLILSPVVKPIVRRVRKTVFLALVVC